MKISHCALHVFRCLIHFQSLFGSSTMNDGTRKSLSKLLHDVCQAIKMHFIVLRYRFGIIILGTMYMKFLFCSVYVHKNLCHKLGTFWRIGSYFPLQVPLRTQFAKMN